MEVSGSGIESNPYVIDVVGSDIAGTVNVQDTTTIDLTRTGSGSSADPYLISGVATVKMTDLTDTTGAPATGDVPVFDGVNWGFAPPPTTPPGAVSAANGITGDGSAGAPLRAATSGTWGVAPLNIFGTNTLLGGEIYIDANGRLRARPPAIDVISSAAQRPSQYPGRVYVRSDLLNNGWSDGTNWFPFAVASPQMIPVPRYRCRLPANVTMSAWGTATNFAWLAFTTPYGAQFHNPMGAIEYRLVSGEPRYVALVDGVFTFEVGTQWNGGTTTGTRKIALYVNGNSQPWVSSEDPVASPWNGGPSSFGTRSNLTATIPLRANEYVRIAAANLTQTATFLIAAGQAGVGTSSYADSYLNITQAGSSTRNNFTP